MEYTDEAKTEIAVPDFQEIVWICASTYKAFLAMQRGPLETPTFMAILAREKKDVWKAREAAHTPDGSNKPPKDRPDTPPPQHFYYFGPQTRDDDGDGDNGVTYDDEVNCSSDEEQGINFRKSKGFPRTVQGFEKELRKLRRRRARIQAVIDSLKKKQKQLDADCIQSDDELEMEEYLQLVPLDNRQHDNLKTDQIKNNRDTAKANAQGKQDGSGSM